MGLTRVGKKRRSHSRIDLTCVCSQGSSTALSGYRWQSVYISSNEEKFNKNCKHIDFSFTVKRMPTRSLKNNDR